MHEQRGKVMFECGALNSYSAGDKSPVHKLLQIAVINFFILLKNFSRNYICAKTVMKHRKFPVNCI
jgi:hypothetical protein